MHDFDHNVKGTLVLLDAARRSGTRRIVLASSNAAASSVSPYGAAKRACEAYGVAFGRCYEMDVLSLRFANVYGPYSTHKTSAVARFIGCALSGDTLPVFGDGNQTRDFVHADDIARGIVLALECPDPGGRSVQIGTGEETSVLQLVETLRRVSGKPLKVRHEPPRAGDIRRGVTDLSAAREALGYEPSLNLEEGLRRTLGWFREQRRSA
jgi:UDP-glucose 4-epimerase